MPLDASTLSSGSTSPVPNNLYEHAVVINDPHSTQKQPTQPRPRPANPMRRLNRADSHSSSTTNSSMGSLSKRLLLEIPRPSSTSALVEADLLPVGCFTPTSPVYGSLRSLADDDKASRRFRLPFPRFLLGDHRSRDSSPARSSTSSLSPPGSPGSTFSSIPSISRTVSFDEPEHEHPSPPNHIRRASISTTSPAPPFSRRMSRTAPPSPMIPDVGMDPILAAAEDASRLRTNCVCTMCGREGANFPRARTGEVFCSRECRIGTRNRA